MIKIDTREKKSIQTHACNLLQNYEITNLDIGDYHIIVNNQLVAIFERKTLKDLANTLGNDSRHHNINKLLLARETCGSKLYYIIESSIVFANDTKKFGRKPFSMLQSFLDTITIKYDITIIYTKSPEHTIKRLKMIKDKYCDIINNTIDYNFTLNIKYPDLNDEQIQVARMWMTIKNIKCQKAVTLINKISIYDAYHEIVNKEYNIILTLDDTIISALKNINQYQALILSQIDRVSLKTAKYLINTKKLSLLNICDNDITNYKLFENSKMKISKNLQKKFIKFLKYKNELSNNNN